MTDNSAALGQARRQHSRFERQQAAAAIQAFEPSGEAISSSAIARRACVSASLLYTDPDLVAPTARDR